MFDFENSKIQLSSALNTHLEPTELKGTSCWITCDSHGLSALKGKHALADHFPREHQRGPDCFFFFSASSSRGRLISRTAPSSAQNSFAVSGACTANFESKVREIATMRAHLSAELCLDRWHRLANRRPLIIQSWAYRCSLCYP